MEELLGDRELIETGLAQHGAAIQFASYELRRLDHQKELQAGVLVELHWAFPGAPLRAPRNFSSA
eukprot:862480-Amphidinium_carterae.1